MNKVDSLLYDALINKGIAAKDTLDLLIKESDGSSQNLVSILSKRGDYSEAQILKVLAEKTGLAFLDLKNVAVPEDITEKIPVKIATYYRFLPIEIKGRILICAVSYPLDIKIQDEIRNQLGYDIELVLAVTEDIVEGLRKYYGLAADTLEKIVSQVPKDSASYQDPTQKIDDIEKLAEDASVIKLVNQIILEAFRKRATDIHIEPFRESVAIRYRIDGLLYDANIPAEVRNFLGAIISRIKIMSNLNIVEHRLPQDGRAVVKVQEQILDLRISTIPTPFGESVVIRILPTQMLFSLERLGLSKGDLTVFEDLIKKPHGIIFVTGPTGSGKTTTLYASLTRINTRDRKIITIEDPIEYEMSGITQIQVMPEIGLDFARGLRSMLRHDPDVIMVGEVRDLETAEIAIRVALTGHLIFSTLHTNDAASGITRLVDIGLEPYLVASSIEAFVAQRLIRLICPDCKYEDKVIANEVRQLIAGELGLKSPQEVKLYRGKGCANCNFSGFFGRTAIYEILLVDEQTKELIVKKSASNRIKNLAVSKGMRTLRQDGWQKVIKGLTTPEEVMRVTSIEEIREKPREEIISPGIAIREDEQSRPLLDSERRIYNRLGSKINLRYKPFKNVQELTDRGFTLEQLSVTRNISAGGILFVSSEIINIGTFLELKLELPNNEEVVNCLARVVRVEELAEGKSYDVAGVFLDITSAQRARLDKYVIKGLEE
ncbi:MAG: ATPase, T2SS/T4P/T4SS family [Candidatus Omnitrophota bacterium]|nr:Flp pilus assembly complex ATPase component TadA [Candidatus Omnitrophota bacterium]MBU1928715.1 Flp pilus assembly complex ATPase component TadA [Candidatus Omnitrophota bacterium]MBU2034170.1 Flp pilus assembly complex ATPase component TadA [Candidatus Omnitrophota bacterium]